MPQHRMTKSDKPVVLIIDDNEAICTLVNALLRRDYDCESVGDGAEAIETLKTKQYAAILLDLRMPHCDGFAVLDYLQAHSPELLKRTLILTASLSAPELARAREYPICTVISKPFEVETLLNAVRDCVGATGGSTLGTVFASGPVILLLADLLRQR